MQNRRDFLKVLAGAGAACAASGCATKTGWPFAGPQGSPMHRYAAAPIKDLKVGVVGIGGRGGAVLSRLAKLPNVTVTAVCDIFDNKTSWAKGKLGELKKPIPKAYVGPEEYKRLCDDPNVDAVYNTTPWDLHVPVQLYAMRAGKHVLTEVPSAFTVDECWELVETSEATKRHCMQLENCCYGEIEMLTFNLAKLGMLGELVHGEGAYIHDLRWMCSTRERDNEGWRYAYNRDHAGNAYPTHGLVPLCLTMDVNRGDKLDYLVSLDSKQANFKAFMEAKLRADHPRRKDKIAMGDMNSTLIKTAHGKSILVQHDVASPRPYSRIQFLSGTKGAICDYPYRVVFEKEPGSGAHEWFGGQQAEEIRKKYRHPLWNTIGELAKRVGGHGGMDFIMDARWVYCLQQGLPLDMDVYDLAVTSCICELTEKSANNRSRAMEIPDFTRGAWRTNKPMDIVDIDLDRFGVANA